MRSACTGRKRTAAMEHGVRPPASLPDDEPSLMENTFFATCPKGTAELLASELTHFGATGLKIRTGGVAFAGDLAVAYRALWWSRVANRILLILGRFAAADEAQLHAGVSQFDWSRHLRANGTLAVDAVSTRSRMTHSQYLAQRTKDAVVDQLRTAEGLRPGVDTVAPDIRLNLYLDRDEAQLAIDLSGDSLHRRRYRQRQGAAPLKENLAAAILLRAHWPRIAAGGGALIDPMCGSGTFLIEAALIAGDVAPGLLRDDPACARWLQHDAALWQALQTEVEERRHAGVARIPPILGYDMDPRVIEVARENVERAGLAAHIQIEVKRMQAVSPAADLVPGLIVTNPPYGERLGTREQTADLYRALGAQLREHFTGWEAALLIGDASLGNTLGIKAQRLHTLYNGALECALLRLSLQPAFYRLDLPPGSARVARAQQRTAEQTTSAGAEMFANRLRKNLRTLGKWARRNGISCYRLYDADMPEYALAIDLYQSDQLWAHVQEYAPPDTIAEDKARMRLDEALAQLPGLLAIPVEQVIFKRRQRQRGTAQYEKLAEAGNFIQVEEDGLRFRVNLRDYLDTGLFLDHRLTRALVRSRSADQSVLNLFAYTGTASVHAAAGGARHVTSVDMSATYCAWARQNLALNGYGLPYYEVIQADCLAWLRNGPSPRYGLIFLDPPTFSNSKRMAGTLDIQRDHGDLINAALQWLAPGGSLIFSTNHRRFRLDTTALAGCHVIDRSHDTLPEDFRRNARIHQCFEISRP